ncbi:DUF4351 domain-containing protein [Iningainema tapete]|uniref:DUF4351 domain-containing protein n=1 Tax=Iningainema tapete TaxID=2806730 RepID=UPI003080F625
MEEGRKLEATIIVLRVATHRFGTFDSNLELRIRELTTAQLEDFNEALFVDFSYTADLAAWLEEHGN